LFEPELLRSFAEVVMIDLTLAGDNAVVIGLAAASLPAGQRRKAIFIGILAATVLRIVFALFTVQLLEIIGLLLAGGILLLWVSWKMYRELTAPEQMMAGVETVSGQQAHVPVEQKTLKQAVIQIILADVSMSLDNVLAVAGAAKEHPGVLIFGLALSIILMAFAANFIAKLLRNHRWIAYVGLAIIFIVALRMIWEGAEEVFHAVAGV
jgi:YjbE family integral membrane protein